MRRPSAKVGAPVGRIMNSWMSIGLSAWAPPLMMFIIGSGRVRAPTPPTYFQSGKPADCAAALAVARLTPRMALAPRRLFGRRAVELDHQGVEPALVLGLGARQRVEQVAVDRGHGLGDALAEIAMLVAVRRSTASCAPVEAPDGTAALPKAPSSRVTSTSTVGLPRLSRISRATISTIWVMRVPANRLSGGGSSPAPLALAVPSPAMPPLALEDTEC